MARTGRRVVFHGAFASKKAAVAKGRKVGGTTRRIMVRGHPRWAVMTKR